MGWIEFWNSLDIFVQTIIKIAAVAPVLYFMWKYVGGQGLCSWLRSIKNVTEHARHLSEIGKKLDRVIDFQQSISALVRPNGGSSVIDYLNRIEGQVHYLTERQHAQLQTSPKAICETDETGAVTWANRAHNRLTGFPLAEIEGPNWINMIAPKCRERVTRLWENAVEKAMLFDENIWFIRPDNGNIYEVRVIAHPITDQNTKLLGYVASVEKVESSEDTPCSCSA